MGIYFLRSDRFLTFIFMAGDSGQKTKDGWFINILKRPLHLDTYGIPQHYYRAKHYAQSVNIQT